MKNLCPPLIYSGLKRVHRYIGGMLNPPSREGSQELDLYWDEHMAEILETWGEGNVWNEIPMFLYDLEGRVLDIACGTGKAMTIIKHLNPKLDVYGCDISDYLIVKAVERGISKDHLVVCDATNLTVYPCGFIDYAYSIGSLEHFTEKQIDEFIPQTRRLVKKSLFHMMPTARSGRNEGWIKTNQSYYNNSTDWWLEKFRPHFPNVHVFDSAWNDENCVGKWFVCRNE